jgi:drug/metabolite transporter (DMT)-like permease
MSAPSVSSAPLRGILYMALGGFFMTLNNAMLKWVADYPLGEILFIRSASTMVLVLAVAALSGQTASLRVVSWKGHAVRAATMVFSAACFIAALRFLPLGETVAITFAGPLFVTALAGPLLGELVGWRRWSAVVVGFLGVLLITRPTAELFQLAVLLPVGAALLSALRDLLTRRMTVRESSMSIMMTTTLGMLIAGLCTLPFGWRMPTLLDGLVMAGSGVMVIAGYYYTIDTFRHAEVALVSPFKYLSIVWATMLGFAVWGDIPDIWMIGGTALVVGSGLYILHREYTTRRR